MGIPGCSYLLLGEVWLYFQWQRRLVLVHHCCQEHAVLQDAGKAKGYPNNLSLENRANVIKFFLLAWQQSYKGKLNNLILYST